jgi:phosphoadenosine phosphosulfate reductase
MSMICEQVQTWAAQYDNESPQHILKLALQYFNSIAISFSGAEDVVLVDMAVKLRPDISVFCLDTGRLYAQTYQFLEQVRERYQLSLEILFPEATAVEHLVRQKGLFSFYKDGHQECCAIRKVIPLRRKLSQLDAWITGQRKDQNFSTRARLNVVEEDAVFSTPNHALVKFNPLANWTSSRIWDYIRVNEVPYNRLHEQGFISIGCEPCTRSTLPNQHEREGRWWWELATHKECGLHQSKV